MNIKAESLTTNIKALYLANIFKPKTFKKLIDEAAKSILAWEQNSNEYDALAFTGVSGAAIAFPLSYLLNKHLICVRKNVNSSHSPHRVEGLKTAGRYVFVDDFISSGHTLRTVQNEIREWLNEDAKLIGIYVFAQRECDSEILCKNLEIPFIPRLYDN